MTPPVPLAGTGATVRPAIPADAPALHRIRAAAFAPVFASFRALLGPAIAEHALASAEADQARHLDDLLAPDSPARILLATLAGAPVAFAAWTTDDATRTGEIGLNAVHPDHAGRGLGTALYAHILDRMREAGMAVVTVSTGGDPAHAPARRAYAKAGFGPSLPSVHLYRTL